MKNVPSVQRKSLFFLLFMLMRTKLFVCVCVCVSQSKEMNYGWWSLLHEISVFCYGRKHLIYLRFAGINYVCIRKDSILNLMSCPRVKGTIYQISKGHFVTFSMKSLKIVFDVISSVDSGENFSSVLLNNTKHCSTPRLTTKPPKSHSSMFRKKESRQLLFINIPEKKELSYKLVLTFIH